MDTSIIVLLITILFFAGITILYIRKKNKEKKATADQFLTARGSTGVWQISLSVIAVVMGSWALFGPAEAATMGGITACIGYAVAQGVAVMLFAIIGVKLRRSLPDGSSMTEYVLARYGKPVYIITLLASLFYMAMALTAELGGIAAAVLAVWGIPVWITVIALLVGVVTYVIYGGIRASLFADTLQSIIIIPTLLLAFFVTVAILGGFGNITQATNQIDPQMLNMGNAFGWEYSLSLVIAICAANLFDQAFWQRTYACKDNKTVRKGFLSAGIIIIPLILICGLFGIMAVATSTVTNPSIALFELIMATAPSWLITVILVLALALVMSTAGACINAISSLLSCEVKRMKPKMSSKSLIRNARIIAIIVAIIGAYVATMQYSVLYLFLVADLICAAAVFPVFFGLYAKRLSGWTATVSIIIGIVVGALLFPDPTYATGNLLYSFSLAIGVPIVICLILHRVGKPTDMDKLNEKIVIIKEQEEEIKKELTL